jgi:hypothetical protein
MSAAEQFDAWLEKRLGVKQMAEIQRKTAKEKVAEREAAVVKIAEIAARRDSMLAEIAPKVLAGTARAKAASAEHLAAHNGLNALRRKQASIGESCGRDILKLERFLRESADPRIDQFVDESRAMEERLHREQPHFEPRKTERTSLWGGLAGIFSTKESILARVEAVAAARREAELLKLQPSLDAQPALDAIRAALPSGEPEMVDTGFTREMAY